MYLKGQMCKFFAKSGRVIRQPLSKPSVFLAVLPDIFDMGRFYPFARVYIWYKLPFNFLNCLAGKGVGHFFPQPVYKPKDLAPFYDMDIAALHGYGLEAAPFGKD